MPPPNLSSATRKSSPKVRAIQYVVVSVASIFGLMAWFLLERLAQEQIMEEALQDNPLFSADGRSKHTSSIPEKKEVEHTADDPFDLDYDAVYARAYKSWPEDRPFPCFPTDGFLNRPKGHLMLVKPALNGAGLFFHRPHKTGSTTVAGTVMRIAHRKKHLVQGDAPTRACRHRANHGSAHKDFKYQDRDRENSFLFSIIRDPAKRATSQFFHFNVVVGQKEPTDANFQKEMMHSRVGHYYIRDMSFRSVTDPKKENLNSLVKEIIDGYDFIGITERMDESLVVFKMLLGLDLEDILYVRERSHGSFSNGPPVTRPCIYVWPSFLTKGMKAFFASEKWMNHMKGDYMLFEAAKKSLDLTIDRLGRAKVEKEVKRFKAALKIAEEICAPRAISMCRDDGFRVNQTTCYIWGEGCSHDCLDEIKIPDAL